MEDLYEADDEDEVTPSWKRQKTAPADDDTRVVEYRCDSPPAAQEIPGGPLYQSLSDDEDAIASSPAHEDEDDDADFTFSPASPPLTQRTEDERTTTVSPPKLYVFPDETVVLTPDGGCVRIPDQHTITHPKPSTSTIEDDDDADDDDEDEPAHPKPSTSTIEDDDDADDDDEDEPADDSRKVCFLKMQTHIARLIAHQWRTSAPSTVEEVTVDVCRSLAVTVLSAAYQDIIMKYVRCAIRRQPNSSM